MTEELKASDQMKWVGLMNNFRTAAEEQILQEQVQAESDTHSRQEGIETLNAQMEAAARRMEDLEQKTQELQNQKEAQSSSHKAFFGRREELSGRMNELDKELFDIGLGVRDVNIISVSYPPEVQKMAEKVAAQSFITDTGKYVTVAAADGMEKGDSVAGLGAQVAIGAQIAQQLSGQTAQAPAAPAAPAADGLEDRFCTKCRKMVRGNFCPFCGTPTV